MNILGYETGPVDCEATFVADFEVSRDIPLAQVISKMDSDRQQMDVRPGMRIKYVPLRFDPATGAHQIGGRYLFEAWDDVMDYMRFTAEDLEFEPGIKFWERPFFSKIDKCAWRVVGAYEFTPLATHYVHRFERFTFDATPTRWPEAAWPTILEAAAEERLAAVWLLIRPDRREIGLFSVATQHLGEDEAESASKSLVALDKKESLSSHLSRHVVLRKLFDRTSLNVSLWLPRSRRLGGDPSIFPTFPVHPLPHLAA